MNTITKKALKEIVKQELTRLVLEGSADSCKTADECFGRAIEYSDVGEKRNLKLALKFFKKTIELDPSHKEAQKGIEYINNLHWYDPDSPTQQKGLEALELSFNAWLASLAPGVVRKITPGIYKKTFDAVTKVPGTKAAGGYLAKKLAPFFASMAGKYATGVGLVTLPVDLLAIYVEMFSKEARRAEGYRPLGMAEFVKFHHKMLINRRKYFEAYSLEDLKEQLGYFPTTEEGQLILGSSLITEMKFDKQAAKVITSNYLDLIKKINEKKAK